jgi:hypothetical protein
VALTKHKSLQKPDEWEGGGEADQNALSLQNYSLLGRGRAHFVPMYAVIGEGAEPRCQIQVGDYGDMRFDESDLKKMFICKSNFNDTIRNEISYVRGLIKMQGLECKESNLNLIRFLLL